MIGEQWSTSNNACIIDFEGGGPYDGQSGLYECDHENFTISTITEDGIQYDYKRVGPNRFRLIQVWVGGHLFKLHTFSILESNYSSAKMDAEVFKRKINGDI